MANTSGDPTSSITSATTQPVSGTVTNSPFNAPLSSYEFAGTAGTVLMNGFFTNASGVKVGNLLNGTVPAANAGVQAGVSFATIYGAALPAGAVYAWIKTAGNLYFDTGAASPSDFTTNTTRAAVLLNVTSYVIFGNGT